MVTGGSSGIGAAAARMLAAEGATVYVGYNSGADRASKLISELPGEGHHAIRIALHDSSTIRQAARAVADAHGGRADILVNSAGFTKPIPHADLDALDDALFDSLFVVNVRGPFSVIRSFAPLLKASGDGVIVNVSSISGFTGSGSSIGYCATKAALDTMTVSLARALGPEIRVLCVSPGCRCHRFRQRTRATAARKNRSGHAAQADHPARGHRAHYSCLRHASEGFDRRQDRLRRWAVDRMIGRLDLNCTCERTSVEIISCR